jgi:hypothetical protein
VRSSMLHGIHHGRRRYNNVQKGSGRKCEDLVIVPALEDRVAATKHRCVPHQWYNQSRHGFYLALMAVSSQ